MHVHHVYQHTMWGILSGRSRVPLGGGANSDLRSVTMDVDQPDDQDQELYDSVDPLEQGGSPKRMRRASDRFPREPTAAVQTTQMMFVKAGADATNLLNTTQSFENAKRATIQAWETVARTRQINPAVQMVRMTASYANMPPAKLLESEFEADRAHGIFKNRKDYVSCDKKVAVEENAFKRQKFILDKISTTGGIMHTYLQDVWTELCITRKIYACNDYFMVDGHTVYHIKTEPDQNEFPLFTIPVGTQFRFF